MKARHRERDRQTTERDRYTYVYNMTDRHIEHDIHCRRTEHDRQTYKRKEHDIQTFRT